MKEAEAILQRTNGGLRVFEHFFGETVRKKLFLNPFRGDSNPSCHLYLHKESAGDRFYMKDYGSSEWSGDCFSIAGKIFNLNTRTSFVEILKKIDSEMGLCIFTETPNQYSQSNWRAQEITKSKEESVVSFSPTYKDFLSEDIEFWSQYGISRTTLNTYNVRSVYNCKFKKENGKEYTVYGGKKKPVFAYLFNQGKGIKLYMPKSPVRFLYAGKLPKPYIFGWEQLPQNGDHVFITGGEKDVLSLAAHGFSAISLNSETAHLQSSMIEELSKRFNHIVFLYDCDETGKRESLLRVGEWKEKYKTSRVLLPLSGEKTSKDISDFFLEGRTRDELMKIIEEQVR